MVEGNSSLMLNPRNVSSHTWDLAIAAILIFTVLSNPLSMAFEPVNERLFAVNVVSDLIFCGAYLHQISDTCAAVARPLAHFRPTFRLSSGHIKTFQHGLFERRRVRCHGPLEGGNLKF